MNEAKQGATVVITHRVRDGHQADYDDWLNQIAPVCRSFPGHLDWQIIRPLAGLTSTYSVVIRFDNREHLENWMNSPQRRSFIEQVQPFLAEQDDFFIRSGLDFWFTPEGANAKVPVRWKQFLVTWSAIYPLALGVPLIIAPLLRQSGVPQNRYVDTLCITGVVVSLMVYLVMPRYTKLIHHWLFASQKPPRA